MPATGGVSESTGQIRLADSGGSGEDHVMVAHDVAAFGEADDDTLVEAARCAEVDVFDAGRDLEARHLKAAGECAVFPGIPFAVHEQSEPFLEGEV
jgi:hypothetical protein